MSIGNKGSIVSVLAVLSVSVTVARIGLATPQPVARSSRDNFVKLGIALLQYSDDFGGALPPMQNAAVAKNALANFVRDDSLFVQPKSRVAYATNPNLSGKPHAAFNTRKVV